MSEILVNTIKKADGTGSITVPAETGTVLTSATSLSSFPSGFANGITEVDTWRTTANITIGSSGQVDLTTSNIERQDTYSPGSIGTGMSYSSGIFTFPSTGIWLIESFAAVYANGSTTNYVGLNISVTTDNSSYNLPVVNQLDHYGNSVGYVQTYSSYVFDVTDVSTHKVKFVMESTSTVASFLGSTSKNNTHFRFTRLGDT